MKHKLQVRILEELLEQIEKDRNIDAGVQMRMGVESYTCPGIAEREWREFFQNTPQLIGLSGRLAEPGSYFICDDFGVPVLATRGKDGTFRAFLNVCRHRGVRLVDEPHGKKSRFTCPFHGWTYANTGELIALRREKDFGSLDKNCRGLQPIPAKERCGMLWVHPQPDGILDLDKHLGPALLEEMSTFDYGRMVYMGESVIEGDLNWKLANDTFGETYHFDVLHKNTLANIFKGNTLSYEEIGQHHRFVFASRTIDRLKELPEEEWHINKYANLLYYIFPNIQHNHGSLFHSLIKIYPVDGKPGRSLTRIDIYAHPEALATVEAAKSEGADIITADNAYEPRSPGSMAADISVVFEVFRSTIEEEDYAMGKQQQANAESGATKEIIFGRNEPALHHYHNTFRKALGQPPLEIFT